MLKCDSYKAHTISALVVTVAAKMLIAELDIFEAREDKEPVEGTEASCIRTLSSLSGVVSQL